MPITQWDHYTVRCADLDTSWAFYRDALGLRVEPRSVASGLRAAIAFFSGGPDGNGGSDGAWLVHLFQATPEQDAIFARMEPPDAEARQWSTRRFHHIALWATGLAEMKSRLQQYGAPFRERTAGERYQIHLNDPDGIEIELNFPIAEAG